MLLLAMIGCGGHKIRTPAGTFTMGVSATSGAVTHTANFNITVN